MRRHLHCGVAVLLDQRLCTFRHTSRAVATGALVNANLLAALATEQHIYRKPRCLSGDVPKRVFNAANCSVDHETPWETSEVHHRCPEMFDVARVLANQPVLAIVDDSHSSFVGPTRVSLANAVDALIGLHFDK